MKFKTCRIINNDNPANWPQDILDRINTLERNDYKGHIGANQNEKDEYLIALKIVEAKEAISRFSGTFNKEYGQG